MKQTAIYLKTGQIIIANIGQQDQVLLQMKFRDAINNVGRDTLFESHADLTPLLTDVYDTICIDTKNILAIQICATNNGD